jgi:hypothetical protein
MKMNQQSWLDIKPYKEQINVWPKSGKHILAQHNRDYVVVYQAYNNRIGEFAALNQYFGGDFSFTRMSWIKPNFLWMMFRSGWGTKPNQETTLAIFLKRDFFDKVLTNAFPSKNIFGLESAVWKKKVAGTDIRLQWDPDHDPYGNKVERRAIQLGLRNEFLEPFQGEGIVRIEDISEFVAQQKAHVDSGDLDKLLTPFEYPIEVNSAIKSNLDM